VSGSQDYLASRVAHAFGDAPADFSEGFLRELRVNWREALARSRRAAFLLVLLSGLFILLVDASVTKISFSGVELSSNAVGIIATALPAIIAYLFAQYWELSVLVDRYEDLHIEICRQLHPALLPLDNALHPPETKHLGSYRLAMLGRSGFGETLMVGTTVLALLNTFLLPFAFIVGCYVALLLISDPRPLAFTISAILGAFFLTRAIGFGAISDIGLPEA
jgi:uncharacterized membrane protein YhaH (DUF805 family)